MAALVLAAGAARAQQTKKVVNFLYQGQVKETYFVLKDKPKVRHGSYQKMRDTEPMVTGFYKQGLRDSLWTEYWGPNQRAAVGHFALDKPVGVWNYYGGGDTLIQRYNHSTRQLEYAMDPPANRRREYTVLRDGARVRTALDRPPLFIGGESTMLRLIAQEVKYPVDAMRSRVSGEVVVELLIDEQGRASTPRVSKSLGHGCDEEVLRAVQLLPSSDWIAGVLGGQPVATVIEIPFQFKMMR